MNKAKSKKRNKINNRRLSIIASIAIILFTVILCCVLTDNIYKFDDAVRYFFYDMRRDGLTAAAKIITYIGNWQSIVILCIALLAVKPLRITYGIPVSAGAAFVTVINKTIKNIVQRQRPYDITHLVNEGGFSFPSGHSITSMLVFGILIYLVRTSVKSRKLANALTIVLALPMILIGISRIYLGVHYPSDVLAGWLLAIAIMAVMIAVIEKYNKTKP